MKKAYWIILIVVLAVGAAAWIFFGRKKTDIITWKTAKIEKGDIQVTVKASGTLNAVTTVQVGTQVSGIINKIYADFNSVVREGQVIAVLDTTYLAQAVDDANASLKRSQIQVNQAKRDFDRTKQLFDQKVMAQADYDLALTTYETAVTNASSAMAALNRAKINLRYATIKAPISGVVVLRAVDVGQTVAASFNTPTLFTIANDLTKMQVQASIDEADIGKILVGQEVTFTVDAYDEQNFSGTVKQVRLQPVVTQNVVNYTVIVDVPNPDLKLLPGMTANITVMIREAKDILRVPASALKFNPPAEFLEKMKKESPDTTKQRQGVLSHEGARGGSPVAAPHREGRPKGQGRPNFGLIWIKEGETLKPRRVIVGLTDGSYTEIKGKINEGDEVIIGSSQAQSSKNAQQQNPFAPQQGSRGPRGGH
ncbi:MAG: efflux RND transporter periplasmic adaptor subunit [bacterium]